MVYYDTNIIRAQTVNESRGYMSYHKKYTKAVRTMRFWTKYLTALKQSHGKNRQQDIEANTNALQICKL